MNTQNDGNKKRIMTIFWGMLILLAGGGLLAGIRFGEEVIAPEMMFLLALCAIAFAIWSEKNWWAIIPGGIFASIGLVVMLEILLPQQDFPVLPFGIHMGVYTWVMLLGFAGTFGVTWLLRKSQPTAWTKYPAVGLLVIALMALILGSRFQEIWMVSVLVAIGAMFVLGLLSRVHVPSRQQPPHLKA